jgi:hypothetical protein
VCELFPSKLEMHHYVVSILCTWLGYPLISSAFYDECLVGM